MIVGAGPNGLTAAAVLAAAGLSVRVLEAKASLGGGCRTEALTRPGFAHDVCGAIHPMGVVSPIFQRLPLQQFGLEWASAPIPLAHPFDDGTAAILERDISRTAAALGEDGAAWTRAVQPFVQQQHELFAEILRPIRVPRYPWPMARFGLLALQSSDVFVERFRSAQAKALFSGCAAHSFLALSAPGSASFGLVLAIAAHAIDWPCARGGSQRIVDALAAFASARGCRFETERPVRSVADLPEVRAVLFDVTPRQLDAIAGDRFSSAYRRRLRRFRYGPGAFKVDYALAGPIPWRAAACRHAATVHVGGTHAEIARAEHAAAHGEVPDAPFVLVRSSRSSTRRALRRGSIPAGPIVMYRTEPTST